MILAAGLFREGADEEAKLLHMRLRGSEQLQQIERPGMKKERTWNLE
jgi:hypothetical protein